MAAVVEVDVSQGISGEGALAKICASFRSGRASHSAVEDFIEQLLAEGAKRVDAFVFEHLFEQRLRKIAEDGGCSVAFCWHLTSDRRGKKYWIRFTDALNPWGEADDGLLRALSSCAGSRNTVVLCVDYDEPANEFFAKQLAKGEWTDRLPLPAVLLRLTRRDPRDVRPMTEAKIVAVAPAIVHLCRWLSPDERKSLSIRRRLINGVLSPHFWRDPTDLDAVVLSAEGVITCVEMKRKYPATRKHKYFGADERPLLDTVSTLAEMGIPVLHILLVAPYWTDSASPVAWLYEKPIRPNWRWLATWLSRDSLVPGIDMSTDGEKSGQRKFKRVQRAIAWEHIVDLNAGLKWTEQGCSTLLSMLSRTAQARAPVTYEFLEQLTRVSRIRT